MSSKRQRKSFTCRADAKKKKIDPADLSPAEQLRRRNLGLGDDSKESEPSKKKPKQAREDAAHNEEDFDADQLGLLMDGTKKSRDYK